MLAHVIPPRLIPCAELVGINQITECIALFHGPVSIGMFGTSNTMLRLIAVEQYVYV